jgi:membrane carboxypeptidase/penicillin-binding protein PbpC
MTPDQLHNALTTMAKNKIGLREAAMLALLPERPTTTEIRLRTGWSMQVIQAREEVLRKKHLCRSLYEADGTRRIALSAKGTAIISQATNPTDQ